MLSSGTLEIILGGIMPTLYKDPSGIFYIISTVKGKRVWRSTHTREKRKAYALFIQSQIPVKPKPPGTKLLSECIADYLPHVKTNFAAATHECYRDSLKRFPQVIGDVEIGSITSMNLDHFKVVRAATVSPATINLQLRAIKSFFNCLVRWEIIEKSPGQSIREIRIPDETPAYFSEEELKRLVDSIPDIWMKNFVIFTAMTGARLGEVLNVT
jgi:integrase